ncbi:rRNA-processing protein sof1, partial [Ascosphaera atra]
MDRMFASPFVCQLGDGHVDGVYSFAKDPFSLDRFASGSGDGVVKIWDLSTRDEIWNAQAHENIVKGMCWTHDRKLLTCAADKTVKLYDPYGSQSGSAPLGTYFGKGAFTGVSHHEKMPTFAASSGEISIYDLSRPTSTPAQTMQWPTSVDTITSLAFNRTETSILGSTALDRSVVLYDLRTYMPVSKAILSLASNSIAWNPMEAFNFAVGSEDHNIYIFDMRKMDRALN